MRWQAGYLRIVALVAVCPWASVAVCRWASGGVSLLYNIVINGVSILYTTGGEERANNMC